MRLSSWLKQAEKQLATAGIGTARLDALILLEDATGKDRSWLLAHPETELLFNQTTALKKLLKRRAQHEPLAYIRGKTKFYGREFVLTPAVLQPRPESETMIELLKTLPCFQPTKPTVTGQQAPKSRTISIADVGTGSGALGITTKLELPYTDVTLIEIDPQAAKVAKINVDKFTLSLPIVISDLLAGTETDYDVLLCNLPYVPNDYIVNKSALMEPEIAIFGGSDGLDIYRKLFQQLQLRSQKPLYILTESLPPQHKPLQSIAQENDYRLTKTDDFIQIFIKR